MWSQPDIVRLNNEAAAAAEARRKSKKPVDPCKGHKCDYCGWAGKKGRALKNAKHAEEYYDLFSDDIKGYVFTCEAHFDHWGGAHEEYFTCEECGKMYILNYTWENFSTEVDDEDGGRRVLCLKCAFQEHIADQSHWLLEAPEEIDIEYLKKVPHVIAVDSHYWEDDLVFVGNDEFDSMDGHQISRGALEETVARAIKKHGQCIILLDAAYQFAVSFGVYVRKEHRDE